MDVESKSTDMSLYNFKRYHRHQLAQINELPKKTEKKKNYKIPHN